MSVVETAVATRERVSSLLLVPWRGQKALPEADALLLHAYAIHKASLCPCGCGFPRKDTLDPEALGAVDIDDSHRCAVKAALDEWRADVGDGMEPGTLPLPEFDEAALRIARARAGRSAGATPEGADEA